MHSAGISLVGIGFAPVVIAPIGGIVPVVGLVAVPAAQHADLGAVAFAPVNPALAAIFSDNILASAAHSILAASFSTQQASFQHLVWISFIFSIDF